MALRINDLAFRDFRSYETLSLHDLGDISIFVGSNAAGKTNIIEGIQLMTALTSFRHPTIEQLIRRGASEAHLSLCACDNHRLLDIALFMEGHTKHYTINGNTKKASDLKGLIPSVTFTPDDLHLVKGAMSGRRHALDMLGCQLNENYHLVFKDYEKVLKHKNKILKEDPTPLLLDSIDEMIITCGAQLTCYRSALFERLISHIQNNYKQIVRTNELFEMWYVPSWATDSFDDQNPRNISFDREKAREALSDALLQRREEEIARHSALVGSHFDEIHFMLDGFAASVYASQGQQRSIVLAYKLAEAAVIEDILEQKPILLLDDVMSELDANRREALIDYISNDVQTFITTANLAYFDDKMRAAANIINLPIE